MRRFKIGDKVVRVSNLTGSAPSVPLGFVFTVNRISPDSGNNWVGDATGTLAEGGVYEKELELYDADAGKITEPPPVLSHEETIIEQIAEAIHESSKPQTKWADLPQSTSNPQRNAALRAARAVVKLYSPANLDAEEAVAVLKLVTA